MHFFFKFSSFAKQPKSSRLHQQLRFSKRYPIFKDKKICIKLKNFSCFFTFFPPNFLTNLTFESFTSCFPYLKPYKQNYIYLRYIIFKNLKEQAFSQINKQQKGLFLIFYYVCSRTYGVVHKLRF